MIRKLLLKLLLKDQVKSGKIILCASCLGDQQVTWQEVRNILDGIKKKKIKKLVCAACYRAGQKNRKKNKQERR
tara:strand:+ start:6123 stop:6344 length:222 start_codon:yes stop_codon:yes gene_type:complete